MQLVAWVVTAQLWALSNAFTAYDCETHTERRRAISLLQPGLCQDPTESFLPKRSVQAQVIQTHQGGLMHIYQCKVTQTRQVIRCGYDSITYTSEYTAWEQVRKLTSKQCQEAVEKGLIILDQVTFPLQNNSVITETIYPFGSVSQGGHCAIESFPEAGRIFHRSFLRVHVKIEIRDRVVGVDEAQGVLLLPNLGIRLEANRYYAHDGVHGTFFWKRKEEDQQGCIKSMSGVYQGNVTLYKHRDGLSGSYVLVANNVTGQVAGLKIGEETTMCAKRCHPTQIQDLLLCDVDLQNLDPQGKHWDRLRVPFRPEFPQNKISLKSQLSYTSLSRTVDLNTRLEDVRDQLCEVERRVLYNKLQAAAAGNRYAFLDQLGKGLQLYKAGAVLYVVECMEVDVLRKEQYPNCTEEIPIQYKNKTMFVEPITMTIQRYPTIIPCAATMPAQWLIGERWYCSWPEIRICQSPKEMQPSTLTAKTKEDKKTTADWLFGAGTDGQIYTKEDQVRHQQAMIIHASNKPLLQDMAMRMVRPGQYDERGRVQWGTPLTKEDIDQLYYDLGEKYFLFFKWFGNAWLAFLGCYMSSVMLKVLFSCLTRMYILYQQYGCGLWVICSVWNMLFLLLGIPATILRSAQEAATDVKKHWTERNEELGLLGPQASSKRDGGNDSSSSSDNEIQKDKFIIKEELRSKERNKKAGRVSTRKQVRTKRKANKRPIHSSSDSSISLLERSRDLNGGTLDCMSDFSTWDGKEEKGVTKAYSASEVGIPMVSLGTSTTGLDGNLYPTLVLTPKKKAATVPKYLPGTGHKLPDQFFGTK